MLDTNENSATGSGRSGRPIRVAIVDDSLTVRTVFSRIIGSASDCTIVAEGRSGEEAVAIARETPCDVMLMDLEMPGIGGLAALPDILSSPTPPKVLVISSLTQDGAIATVTALAMGAADTLAKPSPGAFGDAYAATLLARVRALAGHDTPAPPAPRTRSCGRKDARIIAIAGSTGGIHALTQFLRHLPTRVDQPILIAQHLPDSFVPVFARQIATASGRDTRIAQRDMVLARGSITVAPGNAHLLLDREGADWIAELDSTPAKSGCWPSADPLFESVAETTDGEACAVVLSGMGRDGLEGARVLHEAGGTILAQDAETASVWGMPRAVVEAGLAADVLPPEKLAHAVGQFAKLVV